MSTSAFFLYLRSFDSDQPSTETWATRTWWFERVRKATPKSMLDFLLRKSGPLIEIGGRSYLGLGRVRVSDENWWDDATRAIIHATAIFISPNNTKSLRKELELIFSDNRLLRRAFVIMEPADKEMLLSQSNRKVAEQRRLHWENTRDFFAAHDTILSSYHEGGQIVSLYDPDKYESFSGLSRYRLYDLLQAMAVDLTKLGSYDINSTDLCPCNSHLQFGECHQLPKHAFSS
jgi:hypothetical protein